MGRCRGRGGDRGGCQRRGALEGPEGACVWPGWRRRRCMGVGGRRGLRKKNSRGMGEEGPLLGLSERTVEELRRLVAWEEAQPRRRADLDGRRRLLVPGHDLERLLEQRAKGLGPLGGIRGEGAEAGLQLREGRGTGLGRVRSGRLGAGPWREDGGAPGRWRAGEQSSRRGDAWKRAVPGGSYPSRGRTGRWEAP